MNYQAIQSRGYSEDVSGFSYAFSWFRAASKPGFWHVVAHVPGFSNGGFAVTDDFGNLVRVQS